MVPIRTMGCENTEAASNSATEVGQDHLEEVMPEEGIGFSRALGVGSLSQAEGEPMGEREREHGRECS